MIGRILSRFALPLDRVDVWSNPHYVSVRQTGWPLWLEELSLHGRADPATVVAVDPEDVDR